MSAQGPSPVRRQVRLLRPTGRPPARPGWRVRARVRQLRGVILGAVAVLVVVAAPAAAHDRLTGSTPAADSRVSRVPGAVVLTFSEPVLGLGAGIVVTGPDGDISVGSPRVVDNTVSQPLRPDAPAGAYRVSWRVTSGDGHPIDGEFGFVAQRGPPPGTTTPSSSRSAASSPPPPAPPTAAPTTDPTTDPTGEPTGEPTGDPAGDRESAATPWLVAAAALAGLAAVVLWRRTRHSRGRR